jgi:hypothetical protein
VLLVASAPVLRQIILKLAEILVAEDCGISMMRKSMFVSLLSNLISRIAEWIAKQKDDKEERERRHRDKVLFIFSAYQTVGTACQKAETYIQSS